MQTVLLSRVDLFNASINEEYSKPRQSNAASTHQNNHNTQVFEFHIMRRQPGPAAAEGSSNVLHGQHFEVVGGAAPIGARIQGAAAAPKDTTGLRGPVPPPPPPPLKNPSKLIKEQCWDVAPAT